jgi:hypothetical protein
MSSLLVKIKNVKEMAKSARRYVTAFIPSS